MPFIDIVLAARPTNQVSQTTAVGDTISVSTTRVRNPAAPLPASTLTSFAGDVGGRNWNNYMLFGLTGPCQGLYAGVATVFQDPDTDELSVSTVYQHTGNTSEEVVGDVIAQNVWEGQRGDTMVSPYITAVPTPRANPADPTLWTAIDLGGWLFHITSAGRTITNCGKALPDGVYPAPLSTGISTAPMTCVLTPTFPPSSMWQTRSMTALPRSMRPRRAWSVLLPITRAA
jgi:hypothetical protein